MALTFIALAAAAGMDLAAWILFRRSRAKNRAFWRSLVLALNAVLFSLAALDAGLFLFLRQSDGFNLTISSRNWFADHWNPVNSLGYRDDEPAPPGPGRTAVLVLGDSFAAGHGIDDYRDRFSNLLGKQLGGAFAVYNASDIGWDSTDELGALERYPVTPNIVVLSYYLNDIYGAARRKGFDLPFGVRFPQNALMRSLIEHSALANFIYWRLARTGNMAGAGESFWDRLRKAYADPGVWAEHERELGALAAYCRKINARLLVLVFPNLKDVAASAPLTAKAAAYFQGLGVQAFDLTPMFSGRDPGELVVNAMDAHPNEAVHQEIAGLLRTVIAR